MPKWIIFSNSKSEVERKHFVLAQALVLLCSEKKETHSINKLYFHLTFFSFYRLLLGSEWIERENERERKKEDRERESEQGAYIPATMRTIVEKRRQPSLDMDEFPRWKIKWKLVFVAHWIILRFEWIDDHQTLTMVPLCVRIRFGIFFLFTRMKKRDFPKTRRKKSQMQFQLCVGVCLCFQEPNALEFFSFCIKMMTTHTRNEHPTWNGIGRNSTACQQQQKRNETEKKNKQTTGNVTANIVRTARTSRKTPQWDEGKNFDGTK